MYARNGHEINEEMKNGEETGQESNDKISEGDEENELNSDKATNNKCEMMFVFEGEICCDQIDGKVEIDSIFPLCPRHWVLQGPPVDVPDIFVKISPEKPSHEPESTCFWMIPLGIKKTEKRSNILIPHYKADKREGDDFGAYLCTFKDKRIDETAYYRHFLVDIKPDGPAEHMRINDNDELVLLADEFVPKLNHNEVLERFKAVKVDGITRFKLVIRRVKATKKWEWIETSAILAPDKEVDEKPVVERMMFEVLRGEQIELPKTKHLYKVPGTKKYLDICDGKVSIKTFKEDANDRTKVIWKRAKYYQADGDDFYINFAATLCDDSMKWYIGFDKNKIVLQPCPVWFNMIMTGSKIRFQLGKTYIGYRLSTGEVKPEVSGCVFEELPAPNEEGDFFTVGASNDSTDGATGTSLEASFDNKSFNRSISSTTSSRSADSRSIASSQHSVDSDSSSILSSQVSTDSGGVFTESADSTYDAIETCCLASSLTPSQASKSSGNRSESLTGEHTDIVDSDTCLKKAEHICANQNDVKVSMY